MIKQSITLAILLLSASCHYSYPGTGSPYGSGQGLFIPQIHEVSSHSTANDVVYTRFCKAVCYLYVPLAKTCGLNNTVYDNACQARCDRVGVDATRLKFNDKCCCAGESHKVDAWWATGANNAVAASPVASSFCISTLVSNTSTTSYVNVFAIPSCLATCLDIDDSGDLEYLDSTRTYTTNCMNNLAA